MWSKEQILQHLKENLKESRYNHTLGVVDMAKRLADINGVDQERAELAALIHDCAKNLHIDELFKILQDNSIEVDEIERISPQLLHGKVGAVLGEKLMNISDKEILSAVKYHTTGKANMSTLEKIIYIADYIEPNRNFDGVDKLREITIENLDRGVLGGIDNTLVYIIKNGGLIHPNTVEARNYLINTLKEVNK
ncbi:bis(5'-nucleosyl)-tetraphosphatase (symmetrical) YqeK [Clostridium paridis]|uniref:bis(5'-nucleosyl)-tetraphosphatase (symmetrical) n=1 Tax=Clostridium paridis TaxID=2803863 RepID=A0A937K6M0_9CLOT|nr:bis(5'-nucleosyl)-tetraphosphatase (symmetrical) YqeK [Clostridium paridis]MBL4934035.1 bis(5'-nucleosyl)-tetraphosphatase (symmetrical) YqeK [Clostridium paridis]